jgi:hypothetical protein
MVRGVRLEYERKICTFLLFFLPSRHSHSFSSLNHIFKRLDNLVFRHGGLGMGRGQIQERDGKQAGSANLIGLHLYLDRALGLHAHSLNRVK